MAGRLAAGAAVFATVGFGVLMAMAPAAQAGCEGDDCAIELDFLAQTHAGCAYLKECVFLNRGSPKLARTKDGHYARIEMQQLAITDLGLLVEEARTNNLVYSRDCSQSRWTKENATCTKSAQGIDLGDAAASTVTAGADKARVCQSVALREDFHAMTVFLRRRAGSGDVRMTIDASGEWLDLKATERYQRAQMVKRVANPMVCLELAKAGDAVDIDVAQLETGFFPTSPIVTEAIAVRRADDVIQIHGPARACFTGPAGTVLMESGGLQPGSFRSQYISLISRPPSDTLLYAAQYGSLGIQSQVAGRHYPATFTGSGALTQPFKAASAWDKDTISIVANNGKVANAPATYNNDTIIISPTHNGFLRKLTCWDKRVPDQALAMLTKVETPTPRLTDRKVAWRNVPLDEKVVINGVTYVAQNGPDARSIQISPDGQVIRFNALRDNRWFRDRWNVERAELAAYPSRMPKNKDLWVSYSLLLEPGEDVTTQFLGLGQWLPFASVGSGPAIAHVYRIPETLAFTKTIDSEAQKYVGMDHYRQVLQRGIWYHVVSNLKFDPDTGAGYLRYWINGRQVVDYAGALGYKGSDEYYWKIGTYRGLSGEALSVRYANVRMGLENLSAKIAKPDPIPDGFCYCED